MSNSAVTVVIVSYNQKDLLRRAIESIRKFYKDIPIVVVDGSDPDSECHEYVGTLYGSNGNFEVIRARRNVGHGRGMEMGMSKVSTEFVLLMDSDAEIKSPCLEKMILAMDDRSFGCGQVITVDENGHNVAAGKFDAIPYLHPHFALINREIYRKLPGFIHHGAPCIRIMQHLKNFPKFNLVDFPVWEYVEHKGRGTRVLNPPGFHPGTWEKAKM